jgi:hypothetical protein
MQAEQNRILDVIYHGPLAVYVCAESGIVVAVLDRITGEAASLHYRVAYIAHAKTSARQAWACRQDH